MTLRSLTGWGRTSPSVATLMRPGQLRANEFASPRGIIARGLGRSYGDAAQNGGGIVVNMSEPYGSQQLDPDTGILTAPAGTSLASIIDDYLPEGWFPAVTPGTKHVTLGGALAADIHGKNHHVDGSFSQHVVGFDLRTSQTETRWVTPGTDPELFAATAGGMGLTGLVTRVALQLQRVKSNAMVVDTIRTADLDGLLALMADDEPRHRYSVAWVDLLAKGASMGRGVLTAGDHAGSDVGFAHAAPRTKARLAAPRLVPSRLLNRHTVRAFNEVWYRKAPRQRIGAVEGIDSFFYPLDGIDSWNRVYGKRGLVQYQFVVPLDAVEALREVIGGISKLQIPSFLAVLKRFGPGRGMLSFPIAGWTLALDFPAAPEWVGAALARFDDVVTEAGGRHYLAKDSRMSPEVFRRTYGDDLDRWTEAVHAANPDGPWKSDLGRRLGLVR